MATIWVSLEAFQRIPPEQRAEYGIDLTLGADDPRGYRRANREIQKDYEEEAQAHGVSVADLMGGRR